MINRHSTQNLLLRSPATALPSRPSPYAYKLFALGGNIYNARGENAIQIFDEIKDIPAAEKKKNRCLSSLEFCTFRNSKKVN